MNFYDMLLARKMGGGGGASGKITISQNGTDLDIAQYATADVNVQPNLQTAEATPTGQTQTITPDGQHDGLSSVQVNPIPSQYIVPTGKATLSQNATDVDIAQYASVDVDVHPTDGLVFADFDANGYPTTVSIYRNNAALPAKYCQSFGYSSNVTFAKAIDNIILNEGITGVGSQCFIDARLITQLVFPESCESVSDSTRHCDALEEIVYKGNIDGLGNNALINTSPLRLIFKKNLGNIFNPWNGATLQLLDFSHATSITTAAAINGLGYAAGCVIRVPQALLNDWKSATNWCNLPTDTSLDKYVVWEGV